uniref:GG22914 n=1 Tax=Drosophila erecta TaxID=7220 RepID=B3NZ52_DROER
MPDTLAMGTSSSWRPLAPGPESRVRGPRFSAPNPQTFNRLRLDLSINTYVKVKSTGAVKWKSAVKNRRMGMGVGMGMGMEWPWSWARQVVELEVVTADEQH